MAEIHRQLILHGFEQMIAGADTPAEQRRVRWAREILSSSPSEQAQSLLRLLDSDPDAYREQVVNSDIY